MSDAKTCGQCQRVIPSHTPFGICPVCVLNLATENNDSPATDSHPKPVTDAIPEPHELSGKFPNLEILSLLGRGGMGAVYLARQTSLDRTVALKVLSSGLADDPSFTERFAREAKTLAKLTHPNIVTVFDSGQSGDANYLVMEYVEGVNLRDAIVSNTIDPARALAMVQQICDALQHAHDAGVIHRDIKPENILIDRNGLVKIADFGLAKLAQPKPEHYSLTGTRQVLGTRNYMAPEQIESPESVDHRADLYSLGVVLYELLTGELPIGRFAPPSTKSGCSTRLDDLVMRTLEKDPDQRFQQASMIGSAVRELESSIGLTSGKRPLVQEITRSDRVGAIAREPLTDPLPFSISGLKSKPSSRSGNTLNIAKARGLLHTYDERIEMEYRIHDPLDGGDPVFKADSVQIDDLSSVKFEPTWWGGARLRFKAMSLAAVAKIPKAKQGTFQVNVKNQDRGAAVEFADVANRKIASRNPQRSGAKRNANFEPAVTLEDIVLVDERLKVPFIGFWICSAVTLLAGIVATALVLLSLVSPDGRIFMRDVFGPGNSDLFFFGPIWLLTWVIPLVTANFLKHHRNYHLVIVMLLMLLIPGISALLIVHSLLSIWALVVLCLPTTRRVFHDASMRDRLAVSKKLPILKRIPRTALVAALVCPILFGFLIFNAVGIYKPHNPKGSKHVNVITELHAAPTLMEDEFKTATPEWVETPVTPNRLSNDSLVFSSIGVIAIAFMVFVILILVFMLTTLARNMLKSGSNK